MNVYRGCTKRLYKKKGGEGKTRPLKTKEQMLKQHGDSISEHLTGPANKQLTNKTTHIEA